MLAQVFRQAGKKSPTIVITEETVINKIRRIDRSVGFLGRLCLKVKHLVL